MPPYEVATEDNLKPIEYMLSINTKFGVDSLYEYLEEFHNKQEYAITSTKHTVLG